MNWRLRKPEFDKKTKDETPPIERDSEGLTARQRFLKEQGDPNYLKG